MQLSQEEAEGLADRIISVVRFHHERREYLSRERLVKVITAYPDSWTGGVNGIIPVFRPNTEPCVFDRPVD